MQAAMPAQLSIDMYVYMRAWIATVARACAGAFVWFAMYAKHAMRIVCALGACIAIWVYDCARMMCAILLLFSACMVVCMQYMSVCKHASLSVFRCVGPGLQVHAMQRTVVV